MMSHMNAMDPALFLAVARGDQERLEAIFPRPPPPAPPADQAARLRRLQGLTAEGDGALHVAARLGDLDMVTSLYQLAREAIPEDQRPWRLAEFLRARNQKGETCLHEAVRSGHAHVVRALVETDDTLMNNRSRPLVQMVDDEGVSPLYLATTLRRADIVEIILDEARVHPASSDGPQGRTAMHAAVVVNSIQIVARLLAWNHADRNLITKTDASKSTPLHYLASSRSAAAIARSVLDREAHEKTAHCADSKGSLPIHIAAGHGRLDIIRLLLRDDDVCPICVHARNSSGETFLHVAAHEERSDVVAYVCTQVNISFTAILNARDQNGNTALHLAVKTGNQFAFCKLLSRSEVNLNVASKDGHTPLDLVFLSGKVDTDITETEGYVVPQHAFFTGERSFRYIQNIYDWMVYDLVVAGASRGVHRWDDFAAQFPPKQDTEKEWEKVGKSAGVLSVCAVLILNATIALPFTVATRYHQQPPPPPELSSSVPPPPELSSSIPFRVFLAFDAVAFISAAVATFCCTYAGFATAENVSRLSHLYFGAGCLFGASVGIIASFAWGMYLAFGTSLYVIFPAVVYLFFVISILSGITAPLRSTILHNRALIARVGYRRFLRSLLIDNRRSMFCRFCRRHWPFLLAAFLFVVYCVLAAASILSNKVLL